MFDNIGEKIKGLAKLCFGLYVVLGIILGIAMGVAADGFIGFLLFLIIVAASAVAGYLSVLLLYAFGDLVANVESQTEMIAYQAEVIANIDVNLVEVANNISGESSKTNKGNAVTQSVHTDSGKKLERIANSMNNGGRKWRCPECDTSNDEASGVCRGCGRSK